MGVGCFGDEEETGAEFGVLQIFNGTLRRRGEEGEPVRVRCERT